MFCLDYTVRHVVLEENTVRHHDPDDNNIQGLFMKIFHLMSEHKIKDTCLFYKSELLSGKFRHGIQGV